MTDTDENQSGILQETVTVTVMNNRTGETERIVLREQGANVYTFGGNDTVGVTNASGEQASLSGRLFLLAGDSVSIRYVDKSDPSDSVLSANFSAYHESIASTGMIPTSAVIGDSFAAIISDSDQDFSGLIVETVTVMIRNNRTGETESVVYRENGAGTGHFGGNDTLAVTLDAAYASSGDGRIFAIAGDSLRIQYVDPTDPNDTFSTSAVTAVHDSGASIGAFPATARIGDSISARIIDSDQNRNGFLQETVSARVTNNRTGETETLVLRENGANGGYFGGNDTVPVESDATYSAAGDGRIFVVAGDTISILYIDAGDATDSVLSAPISMYIESGAATGSFPGTGKVGDSVTAVIRDSDQNFSGVRIETVAVTVTNTRTGETEELSLSENGANSGYFGGNDTMPLTLDTTYTGSGNGRLLVLAGDSITIRYADPSDSTDSVLSGNIPVLQESGVSIGFFPASVRIGDSLTCLIGDSDQNFSGLAIETVSVRATNNRTGETELMTLSENGANSGYFGTGESIALTGDAGFAASGDGRLFALAGETITMRYIDPTDAADIAQNGAITAFHDSGGATAVFPASGRIGDSLSAIVRDTDQNLRGFTVETVSVTVTNQRTGETEALGLTENGANAGYFGGNDTMSLTGDATFAAPGDGRLFVLAGDSMTIRYIDSSDPADSTASAFIMAYHETMTSLGIFPASAKIGDSLTAYIRDSDQNFLGLFRETVTVTLTNNRSGETETLVLRETTANGGYFGGNDTILLTLDASFGTSGDGRLSVLAGDTISILYRDPTDSADTAASSPARAFHDTVFAAGVFPASLRIGDSVSCVILDTDQEFDAFAMETVAVTATNGRTGETEIFILREIGSRSGYFGGNDTLAVTLDATFAGSGNGALWALAGDTVIIQYRDPTDTRDSATSGSIQVFHDSVLSSASFPPFASIGDSLTCIVRDSDQNLRGLAVDSVTVIVTNQRTGEVELLVLAENGANAGYFGGGSYLPLSIFFGFGSSGDTILFALPSDTITIRYVDPTDPSDSIVSGLISGAIDTSASAGVFPPAARIGDSLTAFIRDSDQNFSAYASETITVTANNGRTGEYETIVLSENGANGGYFGGQDTLPVSGDATFGPSADGRIFVLAGDTIVIRYIDPNNGSDSIASNPIRAHHDSVLATATFPASIRIGDSFSCRILDTDQNGSGVTVETLSLTATNRRTQETEILVLRENGANAGYFGGNDSLAAIGDAAFAASGDGRLFVLAGDTISLRYVDPTDAADVVFSDIFKAYHDSTPCAGVFPTTTFREDSMTAIVRDTDKNIRGVVRDTVTVAVVNERTGETEPLVLRENLANSGYFGGTETLSVTTDGAHAASSSGRLFVLAGDTITIRYIDPTDVVDSCVSGSVLVTVAAQTSSLIVEATVLRNETIAVTVLDADANRSGIMVETVTVLFRNMQTGETEPVTLVETSANAGGFQGYLATTTGKIDSLPASGRMYARVLDTITLTFTDADDTSDISTGIVSVRTNYSASAQSMQVKADRIGADTYRLFFIPLGPSGETIPSLDGLQMAVAIADSVSGTGSLTDSVVVLAGESAVNYYTRVEAAQLFFSVRLLSDTFFPLVRLAAAGESVPNVISGRKDSTGTWGVLSIPDDHYDTSGYRVLVEPYTDFASETAAIAALITTANSRVSSIPGRAPMAGEVRAEQQFTIRDLGSGLFVHDLDTSVVLTIFYPDADNNGIVDGTGVDERTLRMHYLDEILGVWVVISRSTVDAARNLVSASAGHLTVFTLISVSAAADAERIMIYPNPFRPNDGSADNGREYVSGDLTTGILMDNVPGGSKIRIYTSSGEKVMERVSSASGTYQWDVRNDRGDPVASGQYIVIVEAPNKTRLIEKITVIR